MSLIFKKMETKNSTTSFKLIKRCRVCGDQAVCYNFDVLTCGPCRLFFSRNVHKNKVWKCPTNGNCKLDFKNRKYCRRCRMKKCYEIGMKPKLATKSQTCPENDEKHDEISLRGVLEEGETIDGLDDKYEITLPKNVSKNYFELTLTEAKYIDELLTSTSTIFDFEERKLPVLYEESNFYAKFNLGTHYVRRIIKLFKSNSVFRALNEQEQLRALKSCITEFLMLRYTFAFDPKVGGYYAIGNEEGSGAVFITMNTLYQFSQGIFSPDLVETKKTNSRMLNSEMENDTTIRDLLIVQALFNCTDNAPSSDTLRYHYWIYNHLLLRYLQCKYKNMSKAENKYSTLMNVTTDLKDQIKTFHEAILTLDHRSQFGDLAAEILNLT